MVVAGDPKLISDVLTGVSMLYRKHQGVKEVLLCMWVK